jgi:hypothetical protein
LAMAQLRGTLLLMLMPQAQAVLQEQQVLLVQLVQLVPQGLKGQLVQQAQPVQQARQAQQAQLVQQVQLVQQGQANWLALAHKLATTLLPLVT